MNPRIGYYAHHHGSGHVQRAQLIAEAYHGPVDVLSSRSHPCVTVPLPPDVADGIQSMGRGADVDANGRLHFAPLHSPHLAPRATAIVAWARRARPALVVVDVSVEVALLLRLIGVPVVVVRQHGDRRDPAHTLVHDVAASLLAPYPEWAEDPTATPSVRAKTAYVGGFSRFDGRPIRRDQRDRDEVVVVVGAGGTRLSRSELCRLAAADERHWTVLGVDGPSEPGIGLDLLGTVDDPWPHLERAGTVVVSAGDNALCEAAAAGAPTVAVAEDRPFGEQHHKVRTLTRAGAVAAAPTTWDPEAWRRAIGRARSTSWRDFVDRGGAARAAQHVAGLASALVSETAPAAASTLWSGPTESSAVPCVSCCVIARGRLDHLGRLLVGLERQERPADEVVVVSMGDPDVTAMASAAAVVDRVVTVACHDGGPLPLARARNVAARCARGDLLVFLDVDCIPGPGLVLDYVEHRRPGLLMGAVSYLPDGVPATLDDWTVDDLIGAGRPHPARPVPAVPTATSSYELFWSLNFAVDRATWNAIGGFDDHFEGYGGEDTDFAFTARAAGVAAWFLSGAHAFHQHHPVDDPPVQHLGDIVSNACRFHDKWGEWPMTGWLHEFAERGLVDWDGESLRRRAESCVS